MAPALLVWIAVPLVLPLVLMGMHLALWRLVRHPPPLWQREQPVPAYARVLGGLAGVGLCYLTCAAVFLLAFTTQPTVPTLTLDVVPDSPAAQAGLRTGDQVRSIDGQMVSSFPQFSEGVKRGGARVVVEVERDGQTRKFTVGKDPEGRLGVRTRLRRMTAGEAVPRALASPAVAIAEMAASMVETIAGEERTLMGPVGVTRTVARQESMLPSVALLLCLQLMKIAVPYLVLLLVDALARQRYLASRPALP
jgi:membrane-associated protease RseP (regulator of RpoE activity)